MIRRSDTLLGLRSCRRSSATSVGGEIENMARTNDDSAQSGDVVPRPFGP